MERNCNECGNDEFNKVFETRKSSHRASKDRDERKVQLHVCRECGAEGKRFSDGPAGGKTVFTGTLRA